VHTSPYTDLFTHGIAKALIQCAHHTLFTILKLQDLGYSVDYSKAEPLVEPKARREERLLQQAAYLAAGGTNTGVRYLQNDIVDWPIKQHVAGQAY
jgi:SAM-dependent MidA family methyltransferase